MDSTIFPVRHGMDPNYVQAALTKDISPLEALYDLIDNSVDAARERQLAQSGGKLDCYGLPSGYSGNRVRVRIGSDSVSLSDNCTGIDEKRLAEDVFVTGLVSDHSFGIGGFGIGLKRALFRLGMRYDLTTDTGKSAARMQFNRKELGRIESPLSASRVRSRGSTGTLVHIRELDPGVRHELGSMSRLELAKQLSRRYGLFIRKGLRITVNGERVLPFGPRLRKGGPLKAKSLNVHTRQGVDVFIDSGMHEDYRLKDEQTYKASANAQLTDQYGWYFVCNDRIVKIASHERELGWTANWHQEYYGFVGWVRFVAAHPDELPWDTKKTQIDPNSAAFREVAGKLQEFADAYKVENKKARNGKPQGPPPREGPQAAGAPPPLPDHGKPPAGGGKLPPPKSSTPQRDPKDHNENWGTLLPPLAVSMTHPKILALVFEATELPVANPYAASMLFRAIIEFALFERLKQAKKYSNVREAIFEKQRNDGRPFTEEQKQGFRPTFAQAMEWLNRNDDFFPIEVRRECVTARNKFGFHLKELNGVVHEGDLIDSGKLKIIRNDTLPLLRFLLST